MDAYYKHILPMVLKEIRLCEETQASYESAYTKEQAKISAYNIIKDLLWDLQSEGGKS